MLKWLRETPFDSRWTATDLGERFTLVIIWWWEADTGLVGNDTLKKRPEWTLSTLYISMPTLHTPSVPSKLWTLFFIFIFYFREPMIQYTDTSHHSFNLIVSIAIDFTCLLARKSSSSFIANSSTHYALLPAWSTQLVLWPLRSCAVCNWKMAAKEHQLEVLSWNHLLWWG